MQNKVLVAFIVSGMLGAAVGAIIGYLYEGYLYWQAMLMGAIGGGLTSFPVGGYVVRRQRRWVGMSLLFGLFVGAYAITGWVGVLVGVGASFLTFFIAAGIVRHWYGDNDWKALTSHLKIALGMHHGFQIVDNGQVTYPTDVPIAFGPRNLFIKPYNAVILERGSQITRVVGPSMVTTQSFEYVKHVIALRDVAEYIFVERTATREKIYVGLHLFVTYNVNIAEAARRGDRPLNPDEQQVLKYLAINLENWKQATRHAIKSRTRQLISTVSIESLQKRQRFSMLESRIQNLSNDYLRKWGIRISSVLVEEITLPSEYSGAQEQMWIAEVEAKTMEIRDRGRAQAYSEALRIMASAYKDAYNQGMDRDEIYREVLRRTIEALSGDPSVLLYAPLLRDLMEVLNSPDSYVDQY